MTDTCWKNVPFRNSLQVADGNNVFSKASHCTADSSCSEDNAAQSISDAYRVCSLVRGARSTPKSLGTGAQSIVRSPLRIFPVSRMSVV